MMSFIFLYLSNIKIVSAFNTIFPLLWITRIGIPPQFAALNNILAVKETATNTDTMMRWLENDDSESFKSSVKIDNNRQTGLRGLYATKDINKGEIIVEVPYNAALLVGDSLSSPIFDKFEEVEGSKDWSDDDLDDAYQGLNFIQRFMKDSEYTPYINTLPSIPTSGDDAGLTPDFWSEEYIKGLEVPRYVKEALDRKQIVEQVAKKNNVNEDELRWATWMMRSRRITTWNMVNDPNIDNDDKLFGVFPTNQKVEQAQGFLIPLIDMANHAHDPTAVLKISVNKWTRQFDDTSTFALKALKPIDEGDEVTICYGEGDRTSLDLLDKYGFFLEGNEADKTIDWEELKPEFTTSLDDDISELAKYAEISKQDRARRRDKLKNAMSKMQDYQSNFSSKLDDLSLVGSGIRQKMGIKIYAVAMYVSPALVDAMTGPNPQSDASSRSALRNSVCTFEEASPRTTFVLEMILQADSDTIAEAIADSVKLRYSGPDADVQYLQALIKEGVETVGGNAHKGETLQFDCTKEGVSVSVGSYKQTAKFGGLGRAFVDVFMDDDTVSPSLVENCIQIGGRSNAAQAVNGGEVNIGPESKRTMLSLRVLMKRLSNWTMKSTSEAPVIADESVQAVSVVEEVIEEVVSEEVLPSTAEETDESTKATLKQDTTEVTADLTEEEVANDSDATSEPAPIEPKSEEISPTSFDSADVEARIRELEAEIQKEIARAQSLGAQIEGDSSTTPPLPTTNNKAVVEETADISEAVEEVVVEQNYEEVESKMKSLKDKATSVSFEPKLEDGLYLVGVGVRKKAIINVYAVAMYSSPPTLEALSPFAKGKQKKDAQTALRNSAREVNTSFVLEMTFKADAETIAGAIAEGVKPRYSGSPSDVKELETLIIEGVKSKGGQATKGTIFRFDCTKQGIKVSVDGNEQGLANFDGIGSALVDVFMDDKAVSPQLVDSCLDTWSGVL